MSSNLYSRITVDGKETAYTRKGSQGRKPSGLGKPFLIRLDMDSEVELIREADKLGYYWNKNDFIRSAVREKLNNSIYTELVNT